MTKHTIKMNLMLKGGAKWVDTMEFKTKVDKEATVKTIEQLINTLNIKVGDKSITGNVRFGNTVINIQEIAAISFVY